MSSGGKLEGCRVLIVEDEYMLARDFCEWLQEAGASVAGPTADAAEAAELARREHLDAAIVDINLGNGPTFELAAKLEARGVPFLFATGYDAAAIPTEHQNAPCLEKPFRPQQLVSAVEALRR
jgi:DNA-binding response OmpR family regulator